MKKNKYPIIYSAVLFVASFVYQILYQVKLKEIASKTFDTTYAIIKSYAVSPIFYFSMAFIVAALVLAWAKKPIAKKTKKLCLVGCAVLEAAYVILVAVAFFGPTPPYFLMWFAFAHPWIHVLPGALLSIGTFKD